PRAVRGRELQQELEVVGGLLVRGIGAYRIGEVGERSVELTLRTARRGGAESEDPEQREHLRRALRIAPARDLLERVLRPSTRALDVHRVVEAEGQLRRVDVQLKRLPQLDVVPRAERRLGQTAEPRVRRPR